MNIALLYCRASEHHDDYRLKGQYQPCPTYGVIANQTCGRHGNSKTAESPYMHMYHGQTGTQTVNGYCTTRKCAVAKNTNGSTYCSYSRVHSDLDLAAGDGHVPLSPTTPVTYVCRHNREHDKLTQVPEIVKDSQNCTILRNKIDSFQRKEHSGSSGQLSASRSCENL